MAAGNPEHLPLQVVRLTTTYDLTEDRISVRLADSASQTCQAWLTRRIADRLLRTLIGELENIQIEAATAGNGEVVAKGQARQVYDQLAARLARKKAPAVVCKDDSAPYLVTRIALSHNARQWHLHWYCRDSEIAETTLTTRHMRLWLESLRTCYLDGQWQADFWPIWLGGLERPKKNPGIR